MPRDEKQGEIIVEAEEVPRPAQSVVKHVENRTAHSPVPTALEERPGNVMDLIKTVLEKGGEDSIAVVERLVALQERVENRAAAKEFADAMAKFQEECPPVPKNKTAQIATDSGAKFSYKFAELSVIARHIKPYLHKNGLSYKWDTVEEGGKIIVTCTVKHVNGHQEQSKCTLPLGTRAGMSDQQKVASARHFGERLSLTQALGITTADDDTDGAGSGGGATTAINERQRNELEALVQEAQTTIPKLLSVFGYDALGDLTTNDYPRAVKILRAKIKQNESKAGS